MMLNNRGWGMRDMIIYLCILILFLLFASYSVNTLYENMGNNNVADKDDLPEKNEQDVDLQYYRDLEYELISATFNYLANYYADSSIVLHNTTINVQELMDHEFIDDLYDQFGNNVCEGYSIVNRNEKGAFVVSSYINCSNYKTEGY